MPDALLQEDSITKNRRDFHTAIGGVFNLGDFDEFNQSMDDLETRKTFCLRQP